MFRLTSILLILTLFVQSYGQTRSRRNSIDRAIQTMMTDPALKNASVSVLVMDVDSNQVISEFHPDQSLVTASTMKVITTATALEVLGAFKTFKTKIAYDGEIDTINKVLNGNIYIIGGGDPTLGSKYFTKENTGLMEEWASVILDLGIDSISGRVIGDASYFSDEYVASTWSWGDLGNYYGTGTSGLSIYDNTVEFDFTSGPNKGDSTWVMCYEPYTSDLKVFNRVIASDTKKDEAYIYGAPYDPVRIIKGRIPKGKENFIVKGSMHDPAYVASFELECTLWESGIKVAGPATTLRSIEMLGDSVSNDLTTVLVRKSPPVTKVVYWTNLISNNLFAEHLLKHVGVAKYHDGSVFSSTLAVMKYWKGKGIDMTGFYMNDGSGLSRSNAVTSRQLVEILNYMKTKSKYAKSFMTSLPVCGKTGTLKSLGRKSSIYGNLKAKSGTMTRVKSYAGYVTSASGRNMSFAIIINNYNCSSYQVSKKMERVMIAMGDFTG